MNDDLHQQAVELIAQTKRGEPEQKAKQTIAEYNERRKAATAALQPILTQIWERFEAGETVGGFSLKKDWAKAQGITPRWCQMVIKGPTHREAKSPVSLRFAGLSQHLLETLEALRIVSRVYTYLRKDLSSHEHARAANLVFDRWLKFRKGLAMVDFNDFVPELEGLDPEESPFVQKVNVHAMTQRTPMCACRHPRKPSRAIR